MENVCIGKFRKSHALKGELNAILDIDSVFFLCEKDEKCKWIVVEMEGLLVPFEVENVRGKGNFSVLIKLRGVDTEEDAQEFVNKDIFVTLEAMRKFDAEMNQDEESSEDGFYATDLVGFEVIDSESNKAIGIIGGVNQATENYLFEINGDNGIILVPVVDDYISEVDVENKMVIMTLPEGLVNLNIG